MIHMCSRRGWHTHNVPVHNTDEQHDWFEYRLCDSIETGNKQPSVTTLAWSFPDQILSQNIHDKSYIMNKQPSVTTL